MTATAVDVHVDGPRRRRHRHDRSVTESSTIPEDVPSPRRSRKKQFGWIAAIVALIATAGAAWWVGANTQSPDQAAARAAEPEPSWITAPVEFRILSSTLVTRGDIGPETRTDVRVPTSVEGEPVLTQAVVAAGDLVDDGERVVEVSGRPVFVLQGDTPVYRSLQPAMTGDDVAALQASLVRLGYDIADDEVGTFGATTKIAVDAFYNAAGYAPVPTSATYPADLAAAERLVGDAEAAVTVAQTALSTGTTGPAASEIAQADEDVAAAQRALDAARANVVTDVDLAKTAVDVAKASRTEIQNNPDVTVDEWNAANTVVSVADVALSDVIRDTAAAAAAAQAALDIAVLARQELDTTINTTELQTAVGLATGARDDALAALGELNRVNGPTVPQGEIVFVTTTPTRVLSAATAITASNLREGEEQSSSNGSADALVSLAGGGLIVTTTISPDSVDLVSPGLAVEVLDELADTTYPAHITSVATEATTGSDGQLGHQVEVTPDEPLPDKLAGSNARVTMTAASTGTKQLVVPLAAVSSAADGSARVSILDLATGEPVDIAVTAGLSADGFVSIEPVDPESISTDSRVVVGR